MKRSIFYLFLFYLAGSYMAFGQAFSAGPMIGGGISTVTYQNNEFQEQFDSKIKPSYKAGLSLKIPLTELFVLTPDINYAMRGRKVYTVENEWTLNESHHYLEIPLILNVQYESGIAQVGPFRNMGPFTWYFGAGPNLSYLLGGYGKLETFALKSPYRISFGGRESDYNYITFDPVNRLQWGIDVNIGMSVPMMYNSELITTLRFTYGHTNLGDPDGSLLPVLGFTDNLAHNYKILTLNFAYVFYLDPSQLLKGRSTKGEKIKTKNVGGNQRRRRK